MAVPTSRLGRAEVERFQAVRISVWRVTNDTSGRSRFTRNKGLAMIRSFIASEGFPVALGAVDFAIAREVRDLIVVGRLGVTIGAVEVPVNAPFEPSLVNPYRHTLTVSQ